MNNPTIPECEQSEKPWFEAFRQAPFPIEALPPNFADYVRCQAARFAVDVEVIATIALAQLAGVLATNRSVRSFAGSAINLPFSVIVGMPSGPGGTSALKESSRVLEELQAERLDTAGRLDRRQIEKLRNAPMAFLPGYAKPLGEWDPRRAFDARMYALDVAQHPLFFLESPGARELRNGFAASYDKTLFTMFSDDLLERLILPKRKREDCKLADLLARLARGGQIDVPALKVVPTSRMVQPRFGMVCITTPAALRKAISSEASDVQALMRHSVFLDLPGTAPTGSGELSYRQLTAAGAYWKKSLQNLLEVRRSRTGELAPHHSFYDPLIDWSRRQQAIAESTPESLRAYIATFNEFPAKIGSLFLVLSHYGVWQDKIAAESGVKITEWLMARTLLAASDARQTFHHLAAMDAKEQMLAKIRAFQPINFWELCRRFNKQDKALHQPILEALIEERRVRLNENGKLVAA